MDEVNRSESFLGKAVAVVLFGSMLKPEVDRLSDVDIAVDVAAKESDRARLRELNEQRVQLLESQGHRFRGFLERQFHWHYEARAYLKGGSRVISLADLRAEGAFVFAVPHRVIYAEPDRKPLPPAPRQQDVRRRREKPDPNCPF